MWSASVCAAVDERNANMKVFLVKRNATGWCQDQGMVVVAEDAVHAERFARQYSDDFRKDHSVTVEEVDLSEEHHVLTDNVGA